ncbi:hypothetical protein ACHAWF_000336, partial [Thalassiosira exigua]
RHGDEPEDWDDINPEEMVNERLKDLVVGLQLLGEKGGKKQRAWLRKKKAETMAEARKAGMIEETKEWKERWGTRREREPRREGNIIVLLSLVAGGLIVLLGFVLKVRVELLKLTVDLVLFIFLCYSLGLVFGQFLS